MSTLGVQRIEAMSRIAETTFSRTVGTYSLVTEGSEETASEEKTVGEDIAFEDEGTVDNAPQEARVRAAKASRKDFRIYPILYASRGICYVLAV